MKQIGPDEFKTPFFKEHAYVRRKCRRCGANFWTQDGGAETCGEAPCVPYTFIGESPARKSLSLDQTREKFLDFFERRHHKPLRPYPVVARWRDDVYLVGASIYDFQPYVTEGIIPPPANPLVVSQPCIRFTDIDLVGFPAARHLTCFEMGGHHAFNYPRKTVYWKNETIQFCDEFHTKVLGIPRELITYKEHFWSGGGNAGPDLEVIASGFELATLVFMQYRVDGESLKDLPVRTVDTGYGIERLTWFTNGSCTLFHSIYNRFFSKLLSDSGVTLPEDIIVEFARQTSISNVELGPRETLAQISHRLAPSLRQDSGQILDQFSRLQAASALLDHSKTGAFLLAEGVIPSNSGAGYLARLVLRRTFRFHRELRLTRTLQDLFREQVRIWRKAFPHLGRMESEILKNVDIEVEKYQKNLERGRIIVEALIESSGRTGTAPIPTAKLVELYDSHGLPPETVAEIAAAKGSKVEIPNDFFKQVSERHSTISSQSYKSSDRPSLPQVSKVPSTKELFYEDSHRRSFTAKVLKAVNHFVVLDQTCFYPEGGGQPSDRGILRVNSQAYNVEDVQRSGTHILHRIRDKVPIEGVRVSGEIDWARRQALMRHHTATHILLGACRRTLGEHVWQAGAQKGVDSSRLDITHPSHLTEDEISKIERHVCDTVLGNLPVRTQFLPRTGAEARYGFRLYQGGAVPGAAIRVVNIKDWDAEACGGTHCKHTGEIGPFRILKNERLQDGVERIIFAAGLPALESMQQDRRIMQSVSSKLKASPDTITATLSEAMGEIDMLRQQVRELSEFVVENTLKNLLTGTKQIGPVKLVVGKDLSGESHLLTRLGNRIRQERPDSVAILTARGKTGQVLIFSGEQAVSKGVEADAIARQMGRTLGGGGSGRTNFAQAGGPKVEKIDEALAFAERWIRERVAATS